MRCYAFIDASNLFYGGEKSLGWKIDYLKLYKYLKKKYGVSKVFYFGGVELNDYKYDYLNNNTVSLSELRKYLENLTNRNKLPKKELEMILNHLQRVKFYQKLESFGYKMFLKPVKQYLQEDGTFRRKANCDVEMAFYLTKESSTFDRIVVLSGDGDFLPVLKYLKKLGKKIIILARAERTAKEIKQFAGESFRDFIKLEKEIKYLEKN